VLFFDEEFDFGRPSQTAMINESARVSPGTVAFFGGQLEHSAELSKFPETRETGQLLRLSFYTIDRACS
jgi:hypothetical protein